MQAANLPRRAAVVLIVGLTAACSAIEGYPADPQNSAVTLNALQQKYFTDGVETQYEEAQGDKRQALRDKIIYARIQAYDIQFSQFQRALNANANAINVGTDIIAVALGASAPSLPMPRRNPPSQPHQPAYSVPRAPSTRTSTTKRRLPRLSPRWKPIATKPRHQFC